MKKVRALLVDFDGTIANPHTGELDPVIVKAIQNVLKHGYICSIATGRPYFGRIQEVCRMFGLTSPQIVHGGAEIRNPQDDSILWSTYIEDKDAKSIIEYLLKRKIYFCVEKDHSVFTPDGKRGIYSETFTPKKVTDAVIQKIPKIIIPSSLNSLSFDDLLAIIDDLEKKLNTIHIIRGKVGDHFGLDITAGGATKHTAALEYMKMLGLLPEEVVGVGDGYNDYPLLTACGIRVAMGDAPEEVKDIADMIAPSWEEHGLAEAIKKYFL